MEKRLSEQSLFCSPKEMEENQNKSKKNTVNSLSLESYNSR